jgi:hypothetical protein
MALEGKLELIIKINALPTEVKTDKNGWKSFVISCSGREIAMTVRPKLFNRLTDAAAKWPLWVASIEGKMGKATAKGFVLEEPNVQVFERKAKDKPEGEAAPAASAPASAPAGEATPVVAPVPAEAPGAVAVAPPPAAGAAAPAPTPAAPVATGEPKAGATSAAEKTPASQRPAVFALEQQVRAALLSALEKGVSLEPLCTRHGLPWRRVQELIEQKDSPLTEPQKQTLLTKLLSALRAEAGSAAV